MIEDPSECGICFVNIVNKTAYPCGHSYCSKCIYALIKIKPECSFCNEKIKDVIPNYNFSSRMKDVSPPSQIKEKEGSNISVQVKDLNSVKSIFIGLQPCASILDLKQKLQQLEGHPIETQKLVYRGRRLGNEQTLKSCEITKDSILHLLLMPKSNLSKSDFDKFPNGYLLIKTLTGREMLFTYNSSDSILKIKQKIQEKEGIPVDQFNLRFLGRILYNNDNTLADYKIHENSSLFLVLNLRGD